MAWTVTARLISPNWEIYQLTSNNAADTTTVVNHSLGRVPEVRFFCFNNLAAAQAEMFLSSLTANSFQFNKTAGKGAGLDVCVHLSTLRHPH